MPPVPITAMRNPILLIQATSKLGATSPGDQLINTSTLWHVYQPECRHHRIAIPAVGLARRCDGVFEMAQRAGSANLPLHGGRVPRWLADRMNRLGAVISEAIV